MSDVTLSQLDRLDGHAGDREVTFEMDEEAFRVFYDRTAQPLWGYLSRITGDAQQADDLLQEAYYRFLRTRVAWEGEAHRRAYLFRIATNLVRDGRRRDRHGRHVSLADHEHGTPSAAGNVADSAARRTDLERAMLKLRPRERALLWLAYVQGQPHRQIAEVLGVKTASVKLMLFRARRKLAGLLQSGSPRATGGPDRANR